MARQLDILDEHDPMVGPFAGSIAFHAAVVATLFFGWMWMNRPKETLGEQNPAGGPAYTVSAVSNIPIPKNDAPTNPVAADTKSNLPTAPAKQTVEKRAPIPDKAAIQIPDKFKRQAPQPMHQQQYRQPTPQNQIYSRSPTALSSP